MSKDREQNNEQEGYWKTHLGSYLAWPMAVSAATAIGALFFRAALGMVGNPALSVIPALVAGAFAGNIAFGYFCQDGYALHDQLKKWGESLDKIKEKGWKAFFKKHKVDLLVAFTTLAIVITTVVVSLFFPPAFLTYFATSVGLYKAGVAVLSGGVAFLACRVCCLLSAAIIEPFTKKEKESSSNESGKKSSNVWEKIFHEIIGTALAVFGGICTMIATFDPLLEIFGVGVAASILSITVASIAGLVYFCRDGLSIRERMNEAAKYVTDKVEEFQKKTWQDFLNEYKVTLIGSVAMTVVATFSLSVGVVWQPAPVVALLEWTKLNGLTSLGLSAVTGAVIFGSFFVSSLVVNLFGGKDESLKDAEVDKAKIDVLPESLQKVLEKIEVKPGTELILPETMVPESLASSSPSLFEADKPSKWRCTFKGDEYDDGQWSAVKMQSG